MHKAYRNRPLTQWQKKYNKAISKTRWVVERTFGSLKRWFGSGTTRFKGTDKVHSVHVLEAIAHNLKRSPGLGASTRQIIEVFRAKYDPKSKKSQKTIC